MIIAPLSPLHQAQYLHRLFKLEKCQDFAHAVSMHTHTQPSSLATILAPLLVLEHLYPSSTSTVHAPATLDHATGRNARAQTRQKTCQARGEHARASLWTRQSPTSTRRPSPPIPLSLCTRTALGTSYLLDMLASSRTPYRRRHDHNPAAQYRPCRRSARAIPSSPGRSSYAQSLA